jgi:hypothetical protein
MHSRSTSRKRLLIIGASTAGLAVVAFIVVVSLVVRPQPPFGAGGQLVLALQRFSERHRPLPATVTFSQLISEGYLGTNALKEFGASEVTVYLDANETRPQSFLMDALMPDGTHITALSDGSVQGFTKSRFQQAAAPNGGPTNLPGASDGPGEGRHR